MVIYVVTLLVSEQITPDTIEKGEKKPGKVSFEFGIGKEFLLLEVSKIQI